MYCLSMAWAMAWRTFRLLKGAFRTLKAISMTEGPSSWPLSLTMNPGRPLNRETSEVGRLT